MTTAAANKKKLSGQAQKLLDDAIAATVDAVRMAGEIVKLHKQGKASRAKVIALIKKKPYNAQKVKAAIGKHNALIKKLNAKINGLSKAMVARLEPEARKIESFLKKNKAALSKAGQSQLGTLAKKLKDRLSRLKQDIRELK